LIGKYGLPLLALAGAVVAFRAVLTVGRSDTPLQPVATTACSPYEWSVSGAGFVESSTQNIAIGTHVPGIVTQVFVTAGDQVSTASPLLAIDDRAVRAELEVRRQELQVAEEGLLRLQSGPRAEEVRLAEAKVAEMEAQLREAESQLARGESAGDSVSRGEVSRRRHAVQASDARLAQARASLQLLTAGAKYEDLEVARSQIELARVQVKASETELERLTVLAPLAGEVLQVNIRPGEFAPASALAAPLMLLGDTQTLLVRTDVDERDAWRVRPGAAARASLQGNCSFKVDLTFIRIEPFVVPKKSLTGFSTERVDTRVLQVLYSFRHDNLPVYVGQQLDVMIDASESTTAQTMNAAVSSEEE